jgi:RimJ/RimL family protein N-acetyltransferase
MPPMQIAPVTLHGQHVRMEPLSLEHLPGLWRAGSDPAIFAWYVEQIRSEADMRAFIRGALDAQAAGQALPFATVDARTGQPIGSTRFCNIERAHRRVEIGWTWLATHAQRTAANSEAKYLMLRHAFEVWGCIRVEFKTDSLNDRSRAALLRLGAKEEGTLRNHFICDSGRYRHSVYFSITDDEWPKVKAFLESRRETT